MWEKYSKSQQSIDLSFSLSLSLSLSLFLSLFLFLSVDRSSLSSLPVLLPPSVTQTHSLPLIFSAHFFSLPPLFTQLSFLSFAHFYPSFPFFPLPLTPSLPLSLSPSFHSHNHTRPPSLSQSLSLSLSQIIHLSPKLPSSFYPSATIRSQSSTRHTVV